MAKSIFELPSEVRIGVPAEVVPINLKQQLLLFDYLAIAECDNAIRMAREIKCVRGHEYYESVANDLEFLMDQGLIFDMKSIWDDASETLKHIKDDNELKEWLSFLLAYNDYTDACKLCDIALKGMNKCGAVEMPIDMHSAKEALIQKVLMHTALIQLSARTTAQRIKKIHKREASAIFPDEVIIPPSLQKAPELIAQDSSILEVVLNHIPMPDDDTPWEKILEFKANSDTRGFLQGLRNWMREISSENLNHVEASEKLDWLLFQRKRHFHIHQMSINMRSFGAAFVSAAELAEDIMKLRWGKFAKGIVSIVNRKADLLKLEVEAPGQEIHYLMLTQKEFGN